MSPDGWYYCLTHHTVEPFEGCKALDRLGPYPTPEDAAHALERVAERNEVWDEEDRAWDDDEDDG
ncbi:MAG: hypothetical protein J0I14_10565 [Propionibacteriaceae bacterium]|jgi:hypothetical protein|nr:hypothetical protein [Propionibacteriaceae bacterium]